MNNVLDRTHLELNSGVARLSWTSAKTKNAIGKAEAEDLAERLDLLAADDSTSVIVLGIGQVPFCSGWDIRDLGVLKGATSDEARHFFTYGRRLLESITDCPQPVIAAVSGWALGFGCSILSRCDVVLAADDAKFGVPEVRNGFAPATVVPELLNTMSTREVKAWALTGETVSAGRALSAGLVHEIWSPDKLGTAALQLAETMAGYGAAPLRDTKRLVAEAAGLPEKGRRELGVETAMAHFCAEETTNSNSASAD